MQSLRFYSLSLAGGAAAALVMAVLLRTKKQTAEDKERERRVWINMNGRITDGTVMDVQELTGKGGIAHQLLIYQYDIAGVSYECSQDVTWLRHLIDLHSCRLGLPASIKYDPKNPGNSIVIAEGWTGLRK
jgi:hypothetical protein